jgi:glycosyltransferase involved in cell wall biosynthesis
VTKATSFLQLWILSRNRPCFIKECLLSVLDLIIPEDCIVRIIISDNSTTDHVSKLVKKEFPEIELRRRVPDLSVIDHYEAIISELSGDYAIFFHDDDILEPDYLVHILAAFNDHPRASAIGCNATLIDENGEAFARLNNHQCNLTFLHPKQFLLKYLPSLNREQGVAAFPSYCYKKRVLTPNCIQHIRHAGRTADVFLLLESLKSGPLVWLSQPLMRYRVHTGSDSRGLGIRDYRPLWRRMLQEGISWYEPNFLNQRFLIWHSHYRKLEHEFQPQTSQIFSLLPVKVTSLFSLLAHVIAKLKIRIFAHIRAFFP